ncbi:MAG TPA: hypothetical protein EYF95_10040 [Flavobacteriales bacterium]|nr:hypothetical protein [Flavobacteriales bacterium]HIK68294.1 hypothetical protein [Flavobacteriales bacterium]
MPKKDAVAVISMEEDANDGLDTMSRDDLSMPFFKITQPLTPEVVAGDAKPGQIMNSATGDIYETMEVVPCGYEKQYLEWTPRESGGGLKAVYNQYDGPVLLSSCMKNDKGKDVLPNGNLLIPTAVHYVCAWLNDIPVLGIMSMTSTALKKSRRWNSVMTSIKVKGAKGMFTPPMYGYSYSVKVSSETNNYGTWFNWDISMLKPVDDANMYDLCKKFNQEMKKGAVQVKHVNSDSDDVPF